MRRFSAVLVAILLASAVQAASIHFQIDSSSIVAKGNTIQINIVSDTACNGILLGAIVEAASVNADGQAIAITDMDGVLAQGDPLTWGTLSIEAGGYNENYNGCLFDWPEGNASPAATAQSILASFSYTIDSLWDGTTYYIAPLVETTVYSWAAGEDETDVAGKSYGEFAGDAEVLIAGVQIVPEPITIALLGLGGLFIRRKK